MAKQFSKNTETKNELSITPYVQSQINFCSIGMPVNDYYYIPTSLPQEQAALNAFSGKDPAKRVFDLMHT